MNGVFGMHSIIPQEKNVPSSHALVCPARINAENCEAVSNPAASNTPSRKGWATIGRLTLTGSCGAQKMRHRFAPPIRISVHGPMNANRPAMTCPIPAASIVTTNPCPRAKSIPFVDRGRMRVKPSIAARWSGSVPCRIPRASPTMRVAFNVNLHEP